VPIIAQITAVDQQVRSSAISTGNLEMPNRWILVCLAENQFGSVKEAASGLICVHYAMKGKGEEMETDRYEW